MTLLEWIGAVESAAAALAAPEFIEFSAADYEEVSAGRHAFVYYHPRLPEMRSFCGLPIRLGAKVTCVVGRDGNAVRVGPAHNGPPVPKFSEDNP